LRQISLLKKPIKKIIGLKKRNKNKNFPKNVKKKFLFVRFSRSAIDRILEKLCDVPPLLLPLGPSLPPFPIPTADGLMAIASAFGHDPKFQATMEQNADEMETEAKGEQKNRSQKPEESSKKGLSPDLQRFHLFINIKI
jgi:hypothetical protein